MKSIVSNVSKKDFDEVREHALKNDCVKSGAKGLYAQIMCYKSRSAPDVIQKYNITEHDVIEGLNLAKMKCDRPGAEFSLQYFLCDPNQKKQFSDTAGIPG